MTAQLRKVTRFEVCGRHDGSVPAGGYRAAEVFCEGGPGFGPPCDPAKPCRVWPGTDFYNADVCGGEADWPRGWDVNTPACCRSSIGPVCEHMRCPDADADAAGVRCVMRMNHDGDCDGERDVARSFPSGRRVT